MTDVSGALRDELPGKTLFMQPSWPRPKEIWKRGLLLEAALLLEDSWYARRSVDDS